MTSTEQTNSRTSTPNYITAEQLFTRVHNLSPRVAVFDCDGTLWSGDAGSSFMRWSIDAGLVSRSASDWLNQRYAAYKQGQVSELQICGEMVQVYAGVTEEELRQAAAKFFAEKIEHQIFPEMLRLVSALQAAGVDIWAVSSTCNWVIEEGVTRFQIPPSRVLAASVTCEEGRASGRLIQVPTDEGKVIALRSVGVDEPDAVFGNSVHDAAMLAIARGAFSINPSPALVERSIVEGWPLYLPDAVRPA